MRTGLWPLALVVGVAGIGLGGCDEPTCEPLPERCDAADNDCDGAVDETFPVGRPCDVGVGACAAEGVIACTPDGQGAACVAETGAPSAEVCDGVDNDCDGTVDEPGDLAASGDTGGACEADELCGVGAWSCVGGRKVCAGGPRRTAEVCDGADNDCDGATDEAADLREAGLVGEACGDDKGACEGDTTGCVDGELVCVRNSTPSPELCDGLDNDCDGEADEGGDLRAAGIVGGDCGSAEGACVLGVQACVDGGLACLGATDPAPEVCDGRDDDCDGALDEAVQGAGEPCGSDVGACAPGVLRCVAGQPVCDGERAPADEVCDGLDDDCDGTVDEGVKNRCGACGPEPAEVCDGRDDDCDGAVDEGLGGEPCGSDVGVCERGEERCVAGEMVCEGGRAPAEEACDGDDDDCDGAIDEGIAGLGDRCEREGECQVGALVCAADGGGLCCSADAACVPDRQLGDELCDGEDNDCDGAVDEGWGLGAACEAAGVCGAGRLECLDVHTAGCDVGRRGSVYAGGPEACDGQDDDCDGEVDEGALNACGGCGEVPEERCDGDDDDCDGEVDEGVLNRCGGCGAEPAERCDGRDEDCDGVVDEGFAYAGEAPGALCDGVGRCALGRVECAPDGSAARCSTDPGGSDSQARQERCDGQDDDCDGAVDETFDELGAACDGDDGDLCPGGVRACSADGLSTVCGGDDGPGAADLCDGTDDDCDGAVDEASAALSAGCLGARAQARARCEAGSCVVRCAAGFADADGDLADPEGNGCEAYSGPRFTDVTAAAGVSYVHFDRLSPGICQLNGGHCVEDFQAGGAAVGDYDGDGRPDLYVTRLDARDILFRNRGDGTFEDVSLRAGLADVRQTNGAVWCDVDADGDLDLYVTTMGEDRFLLYINDGAGRFAEEAVARGADVPSDQPRAGFSVSCGDFDRDGWPDLHTTENRVIGMGLPGAWAHARLLRNRGADGPGTFEDVTEPAGVVLDDLAELAVYAYSSTFSDLDDDGWPDLLVAGDRRTSRLFWNDGAGGFVDGTEAAGVGTDDSGMGSAVGDYDGDGRLDWFVTAIYERAFCDEPPCPLLYSGNRLYRNAGDRRFEDRTDEAGVRVAYWGWAASFLDYDNDGDLDLVATNGANSEPWNVDPMRLWRNDGGVMSEVSEPAGLTDTGDGKGLVVFDYDGDGDLDVLVVRNEDTPRLYRNDGMGDPQAGALGWLRVRVLGAAGSPALGARVVLHPAGGGGAPQLREVRAGSNYLGQNEATLHFGLGDADVDRLVVRWPASGDEQVVPAPGRNRTVTVRAQ